MQTLRLVAAALSLAFCTVVQAAGQGQSWTAAPDSKLDSLRGGFAVAPGLMVSFGIVRTVQIDGQVVSRTGVQLNDLRSITVDQARSLRQQMADISLVQNGRGNIAANVPVQPLPGIVIQNTENNRQLQAVTEINATTNGMRILQGMNLNQTMSDALKGAFTR